MKNHKEMMQALVDGHTLTDDDGAILKIDKTGNVVNESNFFVHTFLVAYKDFKIKKPEPKKIYLYETYNEVGYKNLCTIHGKNPNFLNKTLKGFGICDEIRKQNIINPDEPALVLNAETWERIDE